MRDDFRISIKKTLASRVGYRCSKCGCTTAGPDTSQTGSVNIGVAAHITAASPGGPRYDEKMSSEDRSDLSNGIWLCQSCAKEIDDDEVGFPPTKLRELKKEAEQAARDALPGELARHAVNGEFDVLAKAFDLLEKPEDWRASDSQEKCFYCVHEPAYTIREGENIKHDFRETWMDTFPKPFGNSYYIQVFWNGTPLYRTTFVACDEWRFYLPLPQPDGEGGWYLRSDSIAYRIARLYRQYRPLDETLHRCGIQLRDSDPFS